MKKSTGIVWLVLGAAALAGGLGIHFHRWGHKAAVSVFIIGGSDGPTSVFLAGKLPSTHHLGFAAGGLAVLILLAVLFVWSRHKKGKGE